MALYAMHPNPQDPSYPKAAHQILFGLTMCDVLTYTLALHGPYARESIYLATLAD